MYAIKEVIWLLLVSKTPIKLVMATSFLNIHVTISSSKVNHNNNNNK